MQIDVVFGIAKVYNIDTFDVLLGQKFILNMIGSDGSEDWFSDNDPVLDIKINGSTADMTAVTVGKSLIRIMNPAGGIVKQISVNVVENIMATDLGLSADAPGKK